MANQKISQLTAAGALDGTEVVALVQSSETKKAALSALLVYFDADRIPFTSTTGGIAADNVGDALRELQDEILDINADSIAFDSVTGGITTADNVGDALREIQDELSDHLLSNAAHDADDVTFTSSTGGLIAANVGDALRELQDDINAIGSPDADNVTFTSTTGGLISTNVGDALRELQDAIIDLNAYDIAFISDSGGLVATNVHDALVEIYDQMLIPTGRPGGQTLYGGTGASENLYLRSTTDATKGQVIIGSGSFIYTESLGSPGAIGLGRAPIVNESFVISTAGYGSSAGPRMVFDDTGAASEATTQITITFNSDGTPVGAIQHITGDLKLTNEYASGNIEFYTNSSTLGMSINPSGYVGIGGITSAVNLLHIDKADSSGAFAQFTNTTTGQTLTDGFIIGIDANEKVQLWNYESTDMYFGTSNSLHLTIDSAGSIYTKNTSTNIVPYVYTTSGNTSTLAALGTETITVTHGLGVDTVQVIVSAQGSAVARAWACQTLDASGYRRAYTGDFAFTSSIADPTGPSSGQIAVNFVNTYGSGSQYIAYRITVIALSY